MISSKTNNKTKPKTAHIEFSSPKFIPGSVYSSVQVHTGLPPQVEGQTRCFCCVCVSNFTPVSSSICKDVYVILHWWGEAGCGSLFKPTGSEFSRQISARYPVRSGPKQFSTYLKDMTYLSLEVINSLDKKVIGICTIPEIANLTRTSPIFGIYPVLSKDNDKLGHLTISVSLESLSDFHEFSSHPTPDPGIVPSSSSHQTGTNRKSVETIFPDPFECGTSQTNNSKQVDISLIQESHDNLAEGIDEPTLYRSKRLNDLDSLNNADVVDLLQFNKEGQMSYKPSENDTCRLVDELLARGMKLREDMLLSSMGISHPSTTSEAPISTSMGHTTMNEPPQKLRRSSSGFLQELLDLDNKLGSSKSHMDSLPVIVKADQDSSILEVLPDNGSPAVSLSSNDYGDLLHDADLIEQLFYNQVPNENEGEKLTVINDVRGQGQVHSHDENGERSEINDPICLSPNLNDPGNMRPSSRGSSAMSIVELLTAEQNLDDAQNCRRVKKRFRNKKRSSKVSSRSTSRSSSNDSRSRACKNKPPKPITRVQTRQEDKDKDGQNLNGHLDRRGELSTDRLNILCRVHIARVTIKSLVLNLPSKKSSIPVRKSALSRKMQSKEGRNETFSTYFIEYKFPMTERGRSLTGDATRIASKTVSGGEVLFNHHSVYPVSFDPSVLENWWTSSLILTVYERKPKQKLPSEIGSCGIPLKNLLKADKLFLNESLPIVVEPSGYVDNSDRPMNKCHKLQVSVQLTSNDVDFSSALSVMTKAEQNGLSTMVPVLRPPSSPTSSRSLPSPSSPMSSRNQPPPSSPASSRSLPPLSPQSIKVKLDQPTKVVVRDADCQTTLIGGADVPSRFQSPDILTSGQLINSPLVDVNAPLLHALIYAGQGRINCKSTPGSQLSETESAPKDYYCVFRMFWSNDIVTSNVSWGSVNPHFNFLQIAPVLLARSLLERMRNNVFVVEIWNKRPISHCDSLVGLVKLNLHKFYLSFREPSTTNSLLRSQFPVIGTDQFVPIVNPFTGEHGGDLQVLFALGSLQQIHAIQNLRMKQSHDQINPMRPCNNLENLGTISKDQADYEIPSDDKVEHMFELAIQSVRDLSILNEMVWGEADCFIQYHFPANQSSVENMSKGVLQMRSYRSKTTLCIPDPVFHEIIKHSIFLTSETPLLEELLLGINTIESGLPFEVWCRYYHPNVRDQIIAKGYLPLTKLCGMVAMYKDDNPAVHSFLIPLQNVGITAPPAPSPLTKQCSGCLDLVLTYKMRRAGKCSQSNAKSFNITVEILRATGLKRSAVVIAEHDPSLHYLSRCGLNVYTTTSISFLPDEELKFSRVTAGSCAPELRYKSTYSLPFIGKDEYKNDVSLAELLYSGFLRIDVWHQNSQTLLDYEKRYSGGTVSNSGPQSSSDILLGSVVVALHQLVTRVKGIHGWYEIRSGTDNLISGGYRNESNIVGGLELSVKFSSASDFDNLQNISKNPIWLQNLRATGNRFSTPGHCLVKIRVDKVLFPLDHDIQRHSSSINHSPFCYIKYNFFNKGTIKSKCVPVKYCTEDSREAALNYSQDLDLQLSPELFCYLREETLEVQVWLGVTGAVRDRSLNDKLLGSAFLSLDNLLRDRQFISGKFTIFKEETDDLGNATIGASIKLVLDSDQSNVDNALNSDIDEDNNETIMNSNSGYFNDKSVRKNEEKFNKDLNSFRAYVFIERALHLPLLHTKNRGQMIKPNSYVSFQSDESSTLIVTDVAYDSDAPYWSFECDTWLSVDLVHKGSRNLVFKVWHNLAESPDKTSDKVLGFVSVDLEPLATGLRSVSGWYNIADFAGECQGQIKLSITPHESLSSYRNLYSKQKDNVKNRHVTFSDIDQLSHVSHYLNVKHHHQHLHRESDVGRKSTFEKMNENLNEKIESDDYNDSSRSSLFSLLRKQMQELDLINEKLKRKLGTESGSCRDDAHQLQCSTVPFSARKDDAHQLQCSTVPFNARKAEDSDRDRKPDTLFIPSSSSSCSLNVNSVTSVHRSQSRHPNREIQYNDVQVDNDPCREVNSHYVDTLYMTHGNNATCFDSGGKPQSCDLSTNFLDVHRLNEEEYLSNDSAVSEYDIDIYGDDRKKVDIVIPKVLNDLSNCFTNNEIDIIEDSDESFIKANHDAVQPMESCGYEIDVEHKFENDLITEDLQSLDTEDSWAFDVKSNDDINNDNFISIENVLSNEKKDYLYLDQSLVNQPSFNDNSVNNKLDDIKGDEIAIWTEESDHCAVIIGTNDECNVIEDPKMLSNTLNETQTTELTDNANFSPLHLENSSPGDIPVMCKTAESDNDCDKQMFDIATDAGADGNEDIEDDRIDVSQPEISSQHGMVMTVREITLKDPENDDSSIHGAISGSDTSSLDENVLNSNRGAQIPEATLSTTNNNYCSQSITDHGTKTYVIDSNSEVSNKSEPDNKITPLTGSQSEVKKNSEKSKDFTIDTEAVAANKNNNRHAIVDLPNFFMPLPELQESLRKLRTISRRKPETLESKTYRLSTTTKPHHKLDVLSTLPDADVTSRIARIFSSNLSNP